MVTIKDIAEACAVSRATVSKALNGYSDINAQTAKLIRDKANEMGYFPNMAARSLKTNKTYNIGVVFSDELRNGLKHEYFSSVLNSFKDEVEKKGYSITFLIPRAGEQGMTYREQCAYRNLDGVLIACANFDHEDVRELATADIPLVTIDYAFDSRSAVISNNASGMQDLVSYICRKGHRRIAYIHGEKTPVTQKRLAGFHKGCESEGVNVDDELIIQARYRDAELAGRITEELLNRPDRPTCILYPDDFAMIGGLNVIRNKGYRIPEDISIAGYDGSYYSKLMSPVITTVKQNTNEIGYRAAKKLLEEIESPKTCVAEVVMVSGELQKGESVRSISL
ncbi:MAG: LacI family transcriptional regulator [Lachnospiraceae bacterium]|nr:LacI family transcriptional regulator [Lachnospiraceae bacterium]